MSVSSVAPHSRIPAAASDPGAGGLLQFVVYMTTLFFRCKWEFERKTLVKFLIINRKKKSIIIVTELSETKAGM